MLCSWLQCKCLRNTGVLQTLHKTQFNTQSIVQYPSQQQCWQVRNLFNKTCTQTQVKQAMPNKYVERHQTSVSSGNDYMNYNVWQATTIAPLAGYWLHNKVHHISLSSHFCYPFKNLPKLVAQEFKPSRAHRSCLIDAIWNQQFEKD
jgi:hypothetical protein